MDNEQSEDVQFNEPIALYKVSYLFNNELFSIDLILNKNNKKRKTVKGIISQIIKLSLTISVMSSLDLESIFKALLLELKEPISITN
jgi:hypothetical protein